MPRSEDFDRSQVLQNAKEVFWVKGYNGTSMQDLVDATGLNRSSIYNSFGNKMELFQQTLKQYQDESAQLFDNACAQNKNAIETIGLTFLYSLKNIKEDILIYLKNVFMHNFSNQSFDILLSYFSKFLWIQI